MPAPNPTKAQLMAAQYAESQQGGGLTNPADNPAWNDRARVPSPPRRDSAPKITADGVDEHGREAFTVSPTAPAAGFPDGAGSAAPPLDPGEFLVGASSSLFVPEAVRQCPAWKAAGSQDAIDQRALKAAGQIVYLVERAPDQAMTYFRRVLSHPQTGILIFAQLDEKVKEELSSTFIRIALRRPWVFQVCRLLMALRGHIAGPHLFRAVCALAAYHAFLAYADVVSPFGHLEDAAREESREDELTPEEQEQQESEDSVLSALLANAPDDEDEDQDFTELDEDNDDATTPAPPKVLTEADIAKLSVEELEALTKPTEPPSPDVS